MSAKSHPLHTPLSDAERIEREDDGSDDHEINNRQFTDEELKAMGLSSSFNDDFGPDGNFIEHGRTIKPSS